jgi:hypothetical protein
MQFATKVIIAAVPFFAVAATSVEHCRSSEAQKLCGWNNWVGLRNVTGSKTRYPALPSGTYCFSRSNPDGETGSASIADQEKPHDSKANIDLSIRSVFPSSWTASPTSDPASDQPLALQLPGQQVAMRIPTVSPTSDRVKVSRLFCSQSGGGRDHSNIPPTVTRLVIQSGSNRIQPVKLAHQ